MTETMRLSAAVEMYKEQPGAYSNAYDWYRRGAMRDGAISIAGVRIPAWKDNGAWVVATADLERGLTAHREKIELMHLRTSEYEPTLAECSAWRGSGARLGLHPCCAGLSLRVGEV
jgi:hypothetical protein